MTASHQKTRCVFIRQQCNLDSCLWCLDVTNQTRVTFQVVLMSIENFLGKAELRITKVKHCQDKFKLAFCLGIPELSVAEFINRRNAFKFSSHLWGNWAEGYRIIEQSWQNSAETYLFLHRRNTLRLPTYPRRTELRLTELLHQNTIVYHVTPEGMSWGLQSYNIRIQLVYRASLEEVRWGLQIFYIFRMKLNYQT